MLSYKEAKAIADEVFHALKPHCSKIEIAGSIRREKQEGIKDVEIVCLPNVVQLGQFALFSSSNAFSQTDVSTEFRIAVSSLGVALKGKPGGKYMKIELTGGFNLDLFMPSDFDYYRQLAIRTGSADFVRNNISGGWSKKGWCGSDLGLMRKEDCLKKANSWKCINPNGELPPVWTSEQDFFEWLNLKWVEPKYRI